MVTIVFSRNVLGAMSLQVESGMSTTYPPESVAGYLFLLCNRFVRYVHCCIYIIFNMYNNRETNFFLILFFMLIQNTCATFVCCSSAGYNISNVVYFRKLYSKYSTSILYLSRVEYCYSSREQSKQSKRYVIIICDRRYFSNFRRLNYLNL